YNDSLPTPLDLSQFISTGSNRKPFYGAFQPRLGFSYALDPESRTTIFGGWGLYYDRSIFDISVDETLKLTHPTYTVSFADPDSTAKPGETTWNNSYFTADKTTLDALAHTSGKPEAWLIGKNVKVPRSRQWNLGVRRVMGGGDYTLTATLSAVRGENQVTLNWANFGLKPDGSCCVSYDRGGFTPERVGFIIPNAFAYRNVDLRLAKDFPNISGTTMRVTLDLFNAFNYQNLGCFDTGSKTNLSFGHASCVVSDPRRLQVGAEYTF